MVDIVLRMDSPQKLVNTNQLAQVLKQVSGCEGEFSHPLDLQSLRPGLDNLVAQSCDENHQIMMKLKDKKKGDGHFLLSIYLNLSYQAT